MKAVIPAISLLLFLSCTPRYRNEKIAAIRLKDFVNTSTSLKSASEKSILLPYLHGRMSQDVMEMPDQDFFNKFIKAGIQLNSMEVLETEALDDDNIQLLYRVHYTQPATDKITEVIAEKVSIMTYTDKQWKISMIYDLSTKYVFPEAIVQKRRGTVF